ncbi:MAG: OB-fold domain-containing protein [Candidatus Acidiferrales bacterium]|jgi:uncharacterized OB-fold protein
MAEEPRNSAVASNPETVPFWEAAAQGKFLLRHCTACCRVHWYPRALCPFCFSDKTEWIDGPTGGSIYSYSVMRRVPEPYAIAYVKLDGGPTMLTNIVDCDFDALTVGQQVKLVFKSSPEGLPLPMFTPA